ncbi:MAG: amino acid permease [Verrucomicrobia bacterium]|nr:amino acid permease [Verrucomicrobiota bacterium]
MSDPKHQRDIERANAGLLPALGLFTTTMLVIGGVIGSGIFRKPGLMAGQIGSPEILLGVWVLAGVITLIGALTNAETAAMIPATGGQFLFFERMYGPFVAYLFGWAVFAVIQTGSIAALATVFAEYSTQFVALPELTGPMATFSFHIPFIGDVTPFRDLGVKGLAALLIVALTVVNYLGVKFGGAVQNIFTIAKLAGMLLLVLGAFLLPTGGSVAHLSTASATLQPHGLAMVAAIAAALQGAFWAYDGWNKISYVAGEVKNPQRNLPRSLLFGMAAVMAIYCTMNLAYAWVLPVEEMAKSKLVAADVAEKFFAGGGRWIALVVMASTLSAANGTILASARVYFSMARRNVFPALLGKAHPRFHTPAAALVAQAVWSVLLLFSGTFDTLTDTLIFVSWIFYGASAYGVFVLRRKEPDTQRPYRVPGYPWLPWVFVLFSAAFLALTIYNDVTAYRAAVAAGKPALINSAFGLALVMIGTPIYFFYRSRNAKTAGGDGQQG